MLENWEWNDWFHALCWAALLVTLVLCPWWCVPLMWLFEWAVWIGWIMWMEKHHPQEIAAFFEHQKRREAAAKQR
jgi:hypothetical protein